MKLLKEAGYELNGDVIFESVVDEEFAGGNGTLAARFKGIQRRSRGVYRAFRHEDFPRLSGCLPGGHGGEGKRRNAVLRGTKLRIP
jgi:acetylornithine deacetylase/succinyl-diaminopimelate desuccinylase-like protein